MNVRDVMTARPISLRQDAPFKTVAETLLSQDIGGIPIVDDTGSVVGVVSEGDLLVKEAYPPHRPQHHFADFLLGGLDVDRERKVGALTARDVMTSPAHCIDPEASVHVAARMMLELAVNRLPVVEDDHLIGIITRHDIVRVFTVNDDELKANVEAILRHNPYVEPDHLIWVDVKDGVVRLEGLVLYESDIEVAAAVVRGVDGVVGVDRQLRFREHDPSRRDLRPTA